MNLERNSIYRVEVLPRAGRSLRQIYDVINAANSSHARAWFNGLEALVVSLSHFPQRGNVPLEDRTLRQLLYGNRPHRYRVIYAIDEAAKIVSVLHIRHGRRDSFSATEAGH